MKSSLLVPHFFNVVCLIDSIRVSVPVFEIGWDWAFGVGICETWTAGTWVGMEWPVWLWRPDRGKEPGVSAIWLIGLAGVVFILCEVPVWNTNLERFSIYFLASSANHISRSIRDRAVLANEKSSCRHNLKTNLTRYLFLSACRMIIECTRQITSHFSIC